MPCFSLSPWQSFCTLVPLGEWLLFLVYLLSTHFYFAVIFSSAGDGVLIFQTPLPLRERKWMESSSTSLGASSSFFSNFTRACGRWFPPSWFRSHREGFNAVSSVGESRRIYCGFLSWQKTNHPKWENQPPKEWWCSSWKPYLGPWVKEARLRHSLSLSFP